MSNNENNSNNLHQLPQHVQERNRSIAEREALRLARPDRPQAQSLAHANRNKSAVSSTPFGFDTFKRRKGITTGGGGGGGGANDEEGTHGGGGATNSNNQYDEWCGPFSVARQMIARREEARRKREKEQEEEKEKEKNESEKNHHPLDELIQQAEYEKKRKANPSMTWKPKKSKSLSSITEKVEGKVPNLYHKRQRRYQKQQADRRSRTIPSLFELCVKFIVDNFESVESLGFLVDNTIRNAICKSLVASGKMNGAAFDTLAEEGIETLEIVDCTSVTSDQMVEKLNKLIPAGLRALILNHAGRCFTSKAVESIIQNASIDGNIELFSLSLSGAYLLKDADMAKLIAVTASTLSSIQLKACPLIGLEFCSALGSHYASSRGSCLLELALEDIRLSKEHFMTLASASDALQNLKSISLKQMDALDDEVLDAILSSITNDNLEGLDLSNNVNLTDQALSSIRSFNLNGRLKSLQLSGIKNLTAAGFEAFFTFDIPGLPNPPTLRTLDLSNCEFESVNESVINLAIAAASLKRQPNTTESGKIISSINLEGDISTMGGLVSLDVSGGSVTDKNMEHLATQCHMSLRELKLNFCSNVSDKGLGYLVSKVKHQFNQLEIWGCAQITETFLDGHSRVDGGGLEITGVWMSKGSRGSKQ